MGLGAVCMQAGDPADVVKLVDVDEPRDPGPGQGQWTPDSPPTLAGD